MMPYPKKRREFARKRARRQRIKALLLVAALIAGLVGAFFSLRSVGTTASSPGDAPEGKYKRLDSRPLVQPVAAPAPPDPTLAGEAYAAVARELPGIAPGDLKQARQSILEPSWASVRMDIPGRDGDGYYAVFMRRQGEGWRAERSVLIEDESRKKDVEAVLGGIPEDLINPLFPQKDPPKPAKTPGDRAVQAVERATGRDGGWKAGAEKTAGDFHGVRVEDEKDRDRYTNVYLRGKDLEVVAIGRDLTTAEAPGFPETLVPRGEIPGPYTARIAPPETVYDGGADRDRLRRELEEARKTIAGYPGVAGFYVRDLKSGAGYGVRPDQTFFSASTIKIPVMVAVYRDIEAGKLEYPDTFETRQEDWAAGAGWLRWDTPGARTTVEDCLWLMMTQSDNVATNALVRIVGGPERVNEVARSLGAEHTTLYWKLSSERAAVPSLDNRTTPRDLATMLEKISTGEAAGEWATEEMVGLLRQNNLEYWLEAGIPEGVRAANKGGWLDGTYNDAGIVEYEDRPYVLAVLTEYGPEEVEEGSPVLAEISKAIWLAETGKTVEQYEKEQREKEKQEREKQQDKNGKDRSKRPAS